MDRALLDSDLRSPGHEEHKMAFGMKHWIGLTVFGLLLVSIWKLPPSAMEPRERELVLPEVRRMEALNRDVQRTHEVIKHMRWSDSLSALTLEAAVDGLALVFPESYPGFADGSELGPEPETVGLSDSAKAVFRGQVQAEVDALSPRSDLVFGYFVQRAGHASVPGVPYVRSTTSNTYVGKRDGQAYCMQVWATSRVDDASIQRAIRWGSDPTNAVGVCRPYLKHGLPGTHIGEWMEAGALAFALNEGPSRYYDEMGFTGSLARRSYFGVDVFGFSSESVEVDRCMAAIPEGCLATVLSRNFRGVSSGIQRYAAANSPLTGPGRYGWRSSFGPEDEYLLSDLEAEFGPEAFGAFWRSDEEVPVAFESAFGMGMGEWVAHWLGATIKASPPGPRLTKSAALGGMLTISIFAAFAGAWARRRRVN
jgi:hypothetical protein